ncbi:hypothetical protein FQA39_LY14806 [Lamprigera yunnana]|nr:hypothetical protein FQA39_LY14806 [Lamprigera yunnana]
MSWWTCQRLGVLLLVHILNLQQVSTFTNKTDAYEAPEIHSSNRLVDDLINDCKVPTFTCIQKTLYKHIKDFLVHTNSYEINGFMRVDKNNNSVHQSPDNNARDNEVEELGNKVMDFLLTHNMQIQMPQTLFDGAALKISPKTFEGSGLITKLEFVPKVLKKGLGSPRILFKKIKKFIGEKLLHALLAVILVVALLLIKILFFLPLILGVAAAKKLLVKLLLFFFPFLSYLFKLCPYVHDTPHLTKFHHHQHQIAHLHHVPPYISHHEPVHHEVSHHSEHSHPQDFDIGLEYYGGGPDLAAGLHRKTDHPRDPPRTVIGDQHEIHSWGTQTKIGAKNPQMNRPLTSAEIEALTFKAEKEAVLKVRLQQEHSRVNAENKILQQKIQQSLKLQEQLKQQMTQMQQYPKGKTQIIGNTAPVAQAFTANNPINKDATKLSEFLSSTMQIQNTVAFDAFYSPILEKIDKILTSIAFTEEPCKERVICSMYKNPPKFSPHSNLLSAELSRDSSELQKPVSTNAAVIRFYRYVQAARDGQDKRDCLRLYPTCAVNTEQ